jgi:hypothetical protein
MVVGSTSITVVASDIEELILALPAFTGIGRAGILIIAIHQETSHAFAIATRIIQSTGITIVTGPSRGEVQTTSLRRAGILRTRIIIVAILQLTSHALASLAGITKSTSIAVVALSVRGQILAPNCWITAIGRAVVEIIAKDFVPTNTTAFDTGIRSSAGISIVAWELVIGMHATLLRVAEIFGARVVIGTVRTAVPTTLTFRADLSQGTSIAVIACESVVGRQHLAAAIIWVTNCFQAERAGTLRLRTFHLRPRSHNTVIREAVLGANQGAIANVTIF